MRTVSAQLNLPPEELVQKLSYSHLEQLVAIDDPLKRVLLRNRVPSRQLVGPGTQTPDRQSVLRAFRALQR